jgi:hypothetical protein
MRTCSEPEITRFYTSSRNTDLALVRFDVISDWFWLSLQHNINQKCAQNNRRDQKENEQNDRDLEQTLVLSVLVEA